MRSDTLFMIGGCSGSFAAPSENRPVYDPNSPWGLRREPFRRELYGSRTTCYFLRHRDTWILIDQGLGVEPLSEFILDMLDAEGKREAVIHCLQTHFHEDHLEGLRSNALMFRKGLVLRFYSPDLAIYRTSTETWTPGPAILREVLEQQFRESYWPVTLATLDRIGARREHDHFVPGQTIEVGGLTVRTVPLDHPGGCAGMRFEIPGAGSIVVATDYEPPEEPDPGVVEFFDGASLLLADMQYRDEEYEGEKAVGRLAIPRRGWGHGTPRRTLSTILQCRRPPQKVRIVHHDPKRSDMDLRLFYEGTVELLGEWKAGNAFDYEFAHEGDIFWY